MVTYRSRVIVYEGWRPIGILALLGLALQISVGILLAAPFWLVALALIYLFRDPARKVPPKPLAVVSPVDGTVTHIETLKDPYAHTQVVQIQIHKGLFDVMSTRSPLEGKIVKQWFGAVKGAVGELAHAAEGAMQVKLPLDPRECCQLAAESESQDSACRFAQLIQSDEQDTVVMAVKSANRWLKPRCYAHSGDRIGQGQRCGIIPFQAVVRVSVPVAARLEVKVGDHVKGGADTLATLVH